MINSTESEKRFWRKGVIVGIGNAIWVTVLFFFVNKLLGDTFIPPIFIIICFVLCLIASFLIPVVFGNRIFRRKGSSFPEYDQIEQQFDKTANDLILSKLGEDIYLKLYREELNWVELDGIRICQGLLNRDEVIKDDELRFYLYVRMADFYIKDDQYHNAIDYLKRALIINPLNLIVNLKIAEVYEWMGSEANAISSYETAFINSSNVSERFQTHIRSQIERINKKGSRKRLPRRGFTHMR
jgi:tetratricopeptide (TPR) repeat protein